VLSLIAIPAALTLGVTLLRLTGELLDWSPDLFSKAPGGGLAVVGITWLAPIFGFYFGDRLTREGVEPTSMGRAAGLPLAALVLLPLLAHFAARADADRTATDHITIWAVVSVVAAGVGFAAWPTLGRALLTYAFAARLPVVGIMWAAIRWNWGTHYDAAPPGFPSVVPLQRWWWTGVVPQMTIWIAWTVVVGALSGALGWFLSPRRQT
jgi:hypothetical protein